MSKIIPISKAAAGIKPPLKKSELVEALAIREHANILKRNGEIDAEIKSLEATIYTESHLALIRSDGKARREYGGKLFDINSRNDEPYSIDVNIELSPVPPAIVKACRRIKALNKERIPNHLMPSMYDLKRRISARLAGQPSEAGSRVQKLLTNPELSKALDETLAAIKEPKQLQIAG